MCWSHFTDIIPSRICPYSCSKPVGPTQHGAPAFLIPTARKFYNRGTLALKISFSRCKTIHVITPSAQFREPVGSRQLKYAISEATYSEASSPTE